MSVSDARSPTASVLRQSDRLRGGKAMCHATPQEVNLTYSRRVRGLLRAELENTGDPGAFQIVSACGVCPREPRHRLKERSTVTTRQQSEMNPDESILGTNDLGLVRSNDKSYDSGQYYIYIYIVDLPRYRCPVRSPFTAPSRLLKASQAATPNPDKASLEPRRKTLSMIGV